VVVSSVLLAVAIRADVIADKRAAADNLTHVEQEVRLNTDDSSTACLGCGHGAQVLQAVRERAQLGLEHQGVYEDERWTSKRHSTAATSSSVPLAHV
jgi:hypothetical protein